MAGRRVVDPSLLVGLVDGAATQEMLGGAKKSSDPNFPVFGTPLGEDVLLYIPSINMAIDETGETMKTLKSFLHEYKHGKAYGQFRCINGLHGGGYAALGYDGSCPACEATADVWDLYNLKLNTEAKKLGIEVGNDPNDSLKSTRDRILSEMELKNSDEYVTFPIVVIPQASKFVPTPDAISNLKPQFVTWRKKRYEDALLVALESLMDNPGHPAGLFWFWKFSYDTKGKPATPMLAAKNAKYTVVNDVNALKNVEGLRAACEEAAKEFTLVKAAEVVIANQFMYKDDLASDVDKYMTNTRRLLNLSNLTPGKDATIGAGATNTIANFKVAADQTGTGTPTNLGGTGVGFQE